MQSLDIKKIRNSIDRLDSWIYRNGWDGYDPYDIKGTYLISKLQKKTSFVPIKIIRKFFNDAELLFPNKIRSIFGIKKEINAKAMGLFAKGYLNLFRATKRQVYLTKALVCLDWLETNYSKGYAGMCWGYPFAWQSVIFIPKNTPSSVVSSIVGDAFWNAYMILGDCKYLHICESICNFFVNDLNKSIMESGGICFSYTPLDNFNVHNANLFVAEFIIRLGIALNNKEFLSLGEKAANYSIGEQNSDGSLYYWGKLQNENNPNHIDHYHSGFEIRSLYAIWQLTKHNKYKEALDKYVKFYHKELFSINKDSVIPRMTPTHLYPVNIHSCSEAILCNTTIMNEYPQARALLPQICNWVLSNMQTNEGWFVYMIHRKFGVDLKSKIPFIRWGQAWMFLALSQYLMCLKPNIPFSGTDLSSSDRSVGMMIGPENH